MDLLKNITIIILTHFHHACLHRILDYYQEVNVNILVADSSNKVFPSCECYKNLQYHHYPGLPFCEKMAKIFHHVITPYVVLCPDDDFIIPSAINYSLKFLDANTKYNSVHGHCVGFSKTEKVHVYPLYQESIGHDISGTTAKERIKQSMNPNTFMGQFYSVHRTENLKFFFQEIHSQFSNQAMGEVGMVLISAINGKHKTLPIFYTARDSYKRPERYIVPSIPQMISDPELRKEYEIFIKLATTHFCQKTGSSLAEGKKCIEQGIELYLKVFTKKKKQILIYNVSKPIKSLIKLFVPEFLLQYLRNLRLRLIIGDTLGYPFFDTEAKKEWEIIESFILKHNVYS